MVLKDTEKVTLSIAPLDAKGNAASVDGAPVWASSNEAVLTVTASADGFSAVAVAVGPLGTAQVSVQVDADLGEGVKPLAATLDIDVLAGEAVALSIAAGTPEAQ